MPRTHFIIDTKKTSMNDLFTSDSLISSNLQLFSSRAVDLSDNVSLLDQQTQQLTNPFELDLKTETDFQQFQLQLQALVHNMPVRSNPHKSSRKHLKRVKLHRTKCCAVCQQECAIGSKAIKLECKHTYHLRCISQWLVNNSTCPLCRSEVK